MKRKTLINNLKEGYPQDKIKSALAGAGLRADIRAEAVSLDKMAEIFHHLKRST